MAGVAQTSVRLRRTASPDGKGDWDLNAILNREVYPAIHAINATVNQVTTLLNRFVPRFVSGASNPILTTDENALIVVDHSSACELTLSVADAATFTAGASIAMMQYGAGQLTVNKAGTPLVMAETVRTRKQYSSLIITKLRDDEWFLTGDMELF